MDNDDIPFKPVVTAEGPIFEIPCTEEEDGKDCTLSVAWVREADGTHKYDIDVIDPFGNIVTSTEAPFGVKAEHLRKVGVEAYQKEDADLNDPCDAPIPYYDQDGDQ